LWPLDHADLDRHHSPTNAGTYMRAIAPGFTNRHLAHDDATDVMDAYISRER
jgi:hypothetical protein